VEGELGVVVILEVDASAGGDGAGHLADGGAWVAQVLEDEAAMDEVEGAGLAVGEGEPIGVAGAELDEVGFAVGGCEGEGLGALDVVAFDAEGLEAGGAGEGACHLALAAADVKDALARAWGDGFEGAGVEQLVHSEETFTFLEAGGVDIALGGAHGWN
jgi:hypothetical protein